MLWQDFWGVETVLKRKKTRENRARVSPDEEGGYGDLPSAKALVKRSSPRGIEEAV
jgi:hypothetical protein